MYFCGSLEKNTLKFSNGTSFLAVQGNPQFNISVIQTPVSASVPSGQRVNLQCSVYPENQSAELRVFWFRSAAGSSSPEIIHTHNFSRSSRQCVYNFSKIITDESDTGTFYCAVATCGRIIVGNGTPVNLKGPVDLIVLYLGAALGLCVVVIIVLSVLIFNVRPQQDSLYENVDSQDTVELIMKKRYSGDSVYSEVSYFTVDDAYQTR
ncbi:hypothetical protein AMEX_G13266 [Astyanax mexicanus]|uniref:Ig-like domain-containing protein n=1 Tax=Astyanax mexicanus TaxID=7994 RepID=A0A8T2LTZ6_ASTMX|nr:hypothetical protein AMEX_G13266 [Astyanax mexicanus]